MPLEGPGVGPAGPPLALERARGLRDGAPRSRGLGGALGERRQAESQRATRLSTTTTRRRCSGASSTLSAAVKRARLYVSGLGYYEASLNGERVGDHVLDPGWTDVRQARLLQHLRRHPAAASGPQLPRRDAGQRLVQPAAAPDVGPTQPARAPGGGSASLHRAARGRARRRLAAPRRERRHAGASADGPIRCNSVYLGESYDARHEVPGWDRPGFDDAAWRPASRRRGADGPAPGPAAAADPDRRHARGGRDLRTPPRCLRLRPGPELRRAGPGSRSRLRPGPRSGCATASC